MTDTINQKIKCTVYYIYLEGYDDKNDIFKSPVIELTLMFGSINIKWQISDLHGERDVAKWKNIRKYMETNKRSVNFGGGGNSNWNCYCDNNKFILDYIISGCGDSSCCTIEFPCNEMIPYVDKIIDVLEYASLNKQYPNSVIH